MGHSLVGLSLATLATLPRRSSKRQWFGGVCIFVALANLPDWPIPNWGHDR